MDNKIDAIMAIVELMNDEEREKLLEQLKYHLTELSQKRPDNQGLNRAAYFMGAVLNWFRNRSSN